MKNGIIVYRVENQDGCGPYRTGSLRGKQHEVGEWLNSQYVKLDEIRHKRPMPYSDGIFEHTDDDYCGFHGIKKLRQWFTKEELQKLQEAGFQINKYKVPKELVIDGNRQVMFRKKAAKKLATVKPYPERV